MHHKCFKRGEFYFERVERQCVRCWLGPPGESESEFIFELHESFIDDLIAGLTVLKHEKR